MKIGGFQETSLLDYPGKISSIIWTVGCNFHCPFCYNPQLVNEKSEIISEEKILSFLKNRIGKIDALSISGGEPLIQKDINIFIEKVKKLGLLVKIDTNGAFPEKLKELIDENLIDYIAMDVKAPPVKYNVLSGVKVDLSKINESIEIIKNSSLDYEFKTTIIPTFLDKTDIIKIAEWLKGAKKYCIQQFKTNTPLLSDELMSLSAYKDSYLLEIKKTINDYFDECLIRGI
jgi:pyruvate formate lyase activating enzyme